MAPGASSTNDGIREFYAPRITEPSKKQQRQPMPRVEHQKHQRPIQLHNSQNRTKPDDSDQVEVGCLGEIKNYKAGDEFVLLWKWVDDFMDKRRAKKESSKSQSTNKPTLRQPKPTPPSSREARQVPRPAPTPSQGAVRGQATDREDLREYKAQRHTPWGELIYTYQNWNNQQAKKKADQPRQRKREESSKRQATERRNEPTGDHPPKGREPSQTTSQPPDQDHAADSQPGLARKPIPVHNKKRGEVQKHTVKITQLPPVHNSIHLQHTPSNNYRAEPARGQKNNSTRDTRFSDFLHQGRNPPSRETYAVLSEDDVTLPNNRFSSILDPAKAIKKAKEAEKAKGPKCYICSSMNCPGGYRDNITNLWLCAACQQKENRGPTQCSYCGTPNSPNTKYADNGLWLCTNCRNPATPKELPPSPKLTRKASKQPNEYCECDSPCPPIENFENRSSMCPCCERRLTPFPVINPKSASALNERNSDASLTSYGVPVSEYDSDHLYSDDSYDTRETTPPAQKPIGLGITIHDPEEEEEQEVFRPTPPLKDSKYFQESPILPAMDYSQSFLRQPGTKHPYAPSPAPITKKTAITFAQEPSKAKHITKPTKTTQRDPQNQRFNPTTYPYPSPPSSPPALHKPRPASSVYITDEPPTNDYPYPPPPIPGQFANRSMSSSSVNPNALARTEEPVGVDGGRNLGLNRRSSWYDFWKPVFDRTGEKSP